jgi:hypothetical protein
VSGRSAGFTFSHDKEIECFSSQRIDKYMKLWQNLIWAHFRLRQKCAQIFITIRHVTLLAYDRLTFFYKNSYSMLVCLTLRNVLPPPPFCVSVVRKRHLCVCVTGNKTRFIRQNRTLGLKKVRSVLFILLATTPSVQTLRSSAHFFTRAGIKESGTGYKK